MAGKAAADKKAVEVGAQVATLTQDERGTVEGLAAKHGYKLTTGLRFGAPIAGESQCVVEAGPVAATVRMQDGAPYWASHEVSEADLRKAGFR